LCFPGLSNAWAFIPFSLGFGILLRPGQSSRIERLYRRLLDLSLGNYTNADARRLALRLEKYRDEFFTFL